MDLWFVRLAVNLLGYATIFVPGYMMIRYLRKVRYDENAGILDQYETELFDVTVYIKKSLNIWYMYKLLTMSQCIGILIFV